MRPLAGRPARDRDQRPRRPAIAVLIGLALLAIALVAPVGASAATPTTATTTCAGHWPATVQGQPTLLKAGARAGDYLWHDAAGWHLRVTHGTTSKLVFSGRISSTAPLRVRPYRLEGGDYVALSADKLTITYRFTNYGRIDGFDFGTACARKLVVYGAMAGVKLPPGRFYIGRANRHPLQNPFAIWRVR